MAYTPCSSVHISTRPSVCLPVILGSFLFVYIAGKIICSVSASPPNYPVPCLMTGVIPLSSVVKSTTCSRLLPGGLIFVSMISPDMAHVRLPAKQYYLAPFAQASALFDYFSSKYFFLFFLVLSTSSESNNLVGWLVYC